MAGALYDRIGTGYSTQRHPDPRIGAMISAQLDGAANILNVGAGTGSYEPADIPVIALDASMTMIEQRASDAAPCVRGHAESLPFADNSFDTVMAILTYHHWSSIFDGLAELRRVAREQIVILTWDSERADTFWLANDYLPEIINIDVPIFPPLTDVAGAFANSEILTVPVPHDCTDGFMGAYWRRPHAYLDPETSQGISTLRKMSGDVLQRGLAALNADLESGAWETKHGHLLALGSIDLGYRLIVAQP